MKKKIWGIVLLVLGVMALLGSAVNGTFAGFANGVGVSEMTTLVLMIGMIVGGVVLLVRSKKTEE